MVEDLDLETWGRPGCASWLRLESMQIFVIAGNNPSALSLPVVVVDEDFEFLGNPFVGGDVAPLPCQRQ